VVKRTKKAKDTVDVTIKLSETQVVGTIRHLFVQKTPHPKVLVFWTRHFKLLVVLTPPALSDTRTSTGSREAGHSESSCQNNKHTPKGSFSIRRFVVGEASEHDYSGIEPKSQRKRTLSRMLKAK
jgi:hypothetical protein